MANFTAKDVMALREMTGAGMMDCKKAMVETDGDVDKAVEFLREKGLAAAAKKAGRIAAEGAVGSYLSDDKKVGAVVEINCETDFVALTDEFQSFVQEVAQHIVSEKPADVDALLEQKFASDSSKSVSDAVTEKVAKIGEKISIRRFTRYEADGVLGTYIHMGGKIGVLLNVKCSAEQAASDEFATFVKDICMHIAAANPKYNVKEEVPMEELDKEKEILFAQAINEGKPEKIAQNIVNGRIKKHFTTICLQEQPFVKDGDKTVSQIIKEQGSDVAVVSFVRYEMGEGLQKREENFAEEVMGQMK
ncbi:MAG: translation elongation factor Ts [Eubacteriales bacterium]